MNQLPLLNNDNTESSKINISFGRPEEKADEMVKNKIVDYLLMTGLLYFLKGVESEISFTINDKTYLAKADKDNDSISITET